MIRNRPGSHYDRPGATRFAAFIVVAAVLIAGALVSPPAKADFNISVVSTDIDRTPQGNFPGPEDTDANGNGTFDNGFVPVAVGYRWLVQEDTTRNIQPGVSCLNGNVEDCLSVNFHSSYAPPVAQGHSSDSATPVVPGGKRYHVSILPDSGFALGGAMVAIDQTSVQVVVQAEPLPTAQIRIFVFDDKNPINNIPDMPQEAGLAGFKIQLGEAGGKYGASGGVMLVDAFGNTLGTSYPCGDPSCPVPPSGPIVTDANGYVTIKNLAPAKYGIQVIPPTGGECPAGWSGSGEWQQTSTLEGTRTIDAWVKANEPPFFVEFGPPGPHVFIGFTQDCKNDSVFTGGATVTGTVTNLHQSRPPAFTFFSGAPFPGCWVALNDLAVGDGQGIYAGPCNEDSTFSIPDVPAGSYELAIFDANLGLIFGRYGFTVSTAEADGNATIVLGGDGNVPVFAWFARHENMVFNDLNENGFRDPGEPPMAEQAINLRFRDGTVYQSFPTDLDGFVPFDEIFPFFNWFVTEVDFARFKATGMTYVVDAGGEVPPDDGWNMPSRGQLNPMPQYCTAADVAAGTAQTIDPGVDGVLYTDDDVETPCVLGQPIINPNTNNNLSRTEPGVVLTYGYQQFLGQTSLFEWGKKAYDRGENGGISGIVYYAITRAEDDPAYAAAEPWEPGIPRIQLALYQDRNRDGVIDDLSDPPDGPTTADVDNYPFDWAPAYSGEPGWTGTPGPEDLDDGTFVGADGITDGNGVFDYGDAIQIVTTDSWDDSLPTGCQGDVFVVDPGTENIPTDCFDGLRNFNQARPAVFDGGYAFDSYFEGGMAATDVETDGLPSGTYIVGSGAHAIYGTIKEEDRNVDFGDEYTISELQLPPPCVGDLHTVPEFLTMFPDQEVDAGFATLERPLCDRKQVVVKSGTNTAADFFMFTEVPIAANVTGFILDDTANEFDPNAPAFGEKYSPPFMPVSIRDWTGTEIGRTYSDRWGAYNMLVPSTFTANLPMPSGMGPNMLTACMNSPGPISNAVFDPVSCFDDPPPGEGDPCLDPNPAFDPRETITDPFFKRNYSQFCYQFQYMPGSTTYLDTPVVPIAAFAGPGQDGLDCEYPEGTPVIWTVSGVGNGVGGGPWSRKTGNGSGYNGFEIVSAGMLPVPNPDWDGVTFEQQTILRDYGFGDTPGKVYILHEDGSRTPPAPGSSLTIQSWSNGVVKTRSNCPQNNANLNCIPLGTPSGTLIVERADGVASEMGVTVWFEDDGDPADHPSSVAQDHVLTVGPGGSINTAIDMAEPGDLILVSPGTYEELVIMWKPLKLQGWGAASTTINAVKAPSEKIVSWRNKVEQLATGANPAIDVLPSQELGFGLPEPAFLFTEEGPGIIVLAKDRNPNAGNLPGFGLVDGEPNARIDGLGVTGADQGGAIFVNAFARELRISNNRVFGNAGLYGGGIRVGHPFLVEERLAQGVNFLAYNDAENDNVRIYRNQVIENGGTGGFGGGISINHGTDRYQVTDNYVCGNFTQGEGAGIGHYGFSQNGLIGHNKILFNQSFNQGQSVSGGGIFVGGAVALNVTTATCAFNAEIACAADTDCPGVDLCGTGGRCTLFPETICTTDADCAGANTCVAPPPFTIDSLSPGSGRVTIDANLVQGNLAGAGDGGGVRLTRTHGQEVFNSGDPDDWNSVLLSNNIIVDNVSGLAGAVSLQDVPKIDIINNTVANNDSTATAGEAFAPGSPNESTRQPAGIVSRKHSDELLQVLTPDPGSLQLSEYSNPLLLNNIVRRNRTFQFIVCGAPDSPAECPTAEFFGVWPQISSAADELYWDLGVLGVEPPVGDPDPCLDPQFSLLTEHPAGGRNLDDCVTALPYENNNSYTAFGADLFVSEYVNGGRGETIAVPEVGTSITAQPAFDEGGNFIDVRFGPLQPNGDYHLTRCSVAKEAGNNTGLGCPGSQCEDYDREVRPDGNADIGADENYDICLQLCGDDLAEGTEQCDGADDAACPGLCQPDCTCLGTGPTSCAGAIVQYRADQADGTVPYAIPGAGSPWVDLTASAHDGSLFNFAGDASSGWQGTGVPSDPYRLEYDGTNDQRVTIPAGSIAELNPTGDHSVSVWFKTSASAGTPPANGDREMIVEWVEQYAQPYEATSVSYLNGGLYFWDCAGWINTGVALTGDTWYHLVVSKVDLGGGSASEVRVYLDGVNVYTNLLSTCLGDQISEIGIGAGVSSGVGTYTREMSGAIAQLCIFDSALDAAAVQTEYSADVALYTVPPTVCGNNVAEGAEECDGTDDAACTGLCQPDCTCPTGPPAKIVEYRADQADGTVPYTIPGSTSPWIDLTAPPGLAHDGTLANFAGDANSGWQGTGVPSDPYRLEYDGTNDQRVTIPAGSIPELNPTGDHSVAMWFKTSPTAGTPPANNDREIVVEWVERYTSPYQATSVSYLNGLLYFWDCTGAWINTGAALAGDTWYHLVVSKIDKQIDGDASEVRVYLDGVEVYANTSSTCLGDQFSEIGVGTGVAANGSYTREMSGAIAQLSIFDGALDVAEVQTEYLADLALYNVPLTDQAGSGAGDVPTSGVRRRGTGDYSTRDGRGLGTAQPSDPTLDSPSATDVDSAAPTDPSAPAELTITSLAVPDESEGPIGCVGNDPLGRPYDSNAVCMHLSAGDGFATMADGRPLYIFSFRDVTGLDENSMPTLLDEGFLGAEAPAPTIHLDQGDQFYLSLTNVGMAIRPDLFDPHTVHYHGFPNASSAFDGVPDASISVNMNGTLTYYYNVVEPGTYMYHCHVEATEHMQMGMLGNLYVRPAQNQLPGGTDLSGFTHEAGFEYAYNDEDGSTYYDVDVPIQIGSFDADFHDASWNVQPLPFALMEDTYPLLNGRGYPDTVNPGNLATAENGNKESQRVDTRITAQTGQRILLRISNLNVTNFYTLASLGIPMQVVGKDARLHRGPTGTDLYYRTNSVTIGGGESIDVILDTRGLDGVVGTTDDIAPGTYFVYTTNLNFLSNNDEPLGGMMTEIVIEAAP